MVPRKVLINYSEIEVTLHEIKLSILDLVAQYDDCISWYGVSNYKDEKVVRSTYLYNDR